MAEHEPEQVPAPDVPPPTPDPPTEPTAPQGSGKSLTIGAVCKALSQEFDDISISKIRYLEDQKLLTPRRTPGGYRLYSAADVSRLRTILRLQRDEFLPLRVIRQELAAGRSEDAVAKPRRPGRTAPSRRPRPVRAPPCAGSRSRSPSAARCTRWTTSSRTRVPIRGSSPSSPTSGSSRARRATGPSSTTRRSGRSSARSRSWRATASPRATCASSSPLRSGVRAAAADPRPGPALPQPGAPPRGGRGAGEPRRRRVAPQAPPARARPPADRAVSRRGPPGADPRHPGLPEARDRLQGHHAPAPRPVRGRHRGRGHRGVGGSARRGLRRGRRGARVHPGRGDRP